MAVLSRKSVRIAAKSLALSTLTYLVVFESYLQIFVLKAFSPASALYIHVDGEYREATAMEEVLHAILATRFYFWRAVAAAFAVTLSGLVIVAFIGHKLPASLLRIMIAGSVLGGAVGLGHIAYFYAWGSDGSYGLLLACMATGIVAIGNLWRRPDNSLESDACKVTRASS